MKVCLVTFEFPPLALGGISTQSHDLALNLAKNGVEVTVLTASYKNQEYIEDGLFNVIRLKNPLGRKIVKFPAFQFKVWWWMRNNSKNFDVLYFQENSGFLYYLLSLFRKRENTIEQFHHSSLSEFLFNLRYSLMMPLETVPYLLMPVEIIEEYISLKRARRIVTVSEYSKSVLRSWGVDDGKITIIPNAVSDTFTRSSIKPTSNGVVKFLYVGRLVPRKGIDMLIKAAGILKRRNVKNFSLDIVGRGSLFNYCTGIIRDNNLDNCVMLGAVEQPELEKLYLEADCLICPSRLEGFGVVLLEAAANNLAIIASDIPVFREISCDNQFLFFKKNDANDLADKMEMLVDSPQLIKALSIKASSIVEKYRWQNVLQQYLRLFSGVVEAGI